MSLLNIPVMNPNLVNSTSELIAQPNTPSFINQEGSGKGKKKSKAIRKSKSISISKSKSISKDKTKKVPKKEKEINKYKKDVLLKLAKKHGINCRKKDGNQRTKEQLFRSLKRKNLI
jgi:hypothetical protein